MIRQLDRYLAREMAMPMIFGIAAFTSLFVSGDLLQLARLVVDTGAPLDVAAKVFILKLPQVLVWTFPMAVLLAVLLSLSKLSANSEIVAMQSGGVSLYRMAAPILLVAAAVTMLTFFINETVVPPSNAKAHKLTVVDIRGGQLPRVTRNVILKKYENSTLKWFLYARSFDGQTQVMSDVTMVELQDGRPDRTTYAERIVWQDDAWYIEKGVTYWHGEDGSQVTMKYTDSRQPIAIGQRPENISTVQKDPEQMTIAELKQHIEILRSQGAEVQKELVQLDLKYAIPFASLIFAFIGVPLGIQPHRSASSIGFGLSIVVIFIYYVVMTFSSALGQGGYLPAWLAAWAQNIVLGAAGTWLLVKEAQ